jgi:hypothetical protein
VPAIENELNELGTRITKKFNLTGKVRLSIFLPVRTGVLRWRLQMVCKTKNIDKRELEASFILKEGGIGYTFLKASEYHVEFVDTSNRSKFPSTYVTLSSVNQNLIDTGIKAIMVVAAFQENSILGLLAVDTDEILDLEKMKTNNVHQLVLSWIIDRRKIIRLLWRMKNNV